MLKIWRRADSDYETLLNTPIIKRWKKCVCVWEIEWVSEWERGVKMSEKELVQFLPGLDETGASIK